MAVTPPPDAAPVPDAGAPIDGGLSDPDGGSQDVPDAAAPFDPWSYGPAFGARRHPNGDLEVRVRAIRATRLELCLFAAAFGEAERLRLPLDQSGEIFSLRVTEQQLLAAGLDRAVYYGLRAFGPNWPHDPAWAPGQSDGFVSDVDPVGNRMNPNKLLLDPYALEVSHDPAHERNRDLSFFDTGTSSRAIDSGPYAPKGVVIDLPPPATGAPLRAFKDEIISEVHLRGLTKADLETPEIVRGTYAGAAHRAVYLRELGITALELLPLHETQNDQNELSVDSAGDNYWGYSSLSFFAPDRRFSSDRSPGGPTRELRAMIDSFHAQGIKVYVDVVFNHTGEGGARDDRARIYSFRGLDNAGYYQLAADPAGYVNSNGVGPNVNTASPITAQLIIDSLRYWHEILGADGFRFDLAAVVGNGCDRECFRFERAGLLERIATELSRPAGGGQGIDLIAEPWGVGPGTYQIGNFPAGWSEWNDHFRDTIRRDLNRLDVQDVTPRELARRWAGSPDLFGDDGRSPAASINYVVSHDGFTLRDLFSYGERRNDQAWPCGPSNGGNLDELQWDHRAMPERQRRAARTALAFAALSAGVPMITGGDEMLRTQSGNNNPYNIDSTCTWLDWSQLGAEASFYRFTKRLFNFRQAHPALRPVSYWSSEIVWLEDDGTVADANYLDAADRHFLGLQIDGAALGDSASSIYVAYNGWSSAVIATLPPLPNGARWRLVADTGIAAESWDNWRESSEALPIDAPTYTLDSRSLAVMVTP